MQKIRLFLSSPGDVDDERGEVSKVAAQINRRLGDLLDFYLEVIACNTHVLPGMGRPQEVINSQIEDYDIFVGIMWKRFGTPTGKAESGTEEEFTIAYKNWQRFKKPHILFYFSLMPYTPKDKKEIDQWGKVIDFKERLSRKGLITKYQTREEFSELLGDHLTKILIKWFPLPKGAQPPADFNRYLTYLKNETMYIDIRGLMTGECKVHQFRIDQLYIPLKIAGAGWAADERQRKGDGHSERIMPREVLLPEALKESRLIIKGDPGAGKSTFLRLITFTLCCKWEGQEPDIKGPTGISWPEPPPLPIFIPLGDLINHINEWKGKDPHHTPAQEDDPQWLSHFLMKQSEIYKFKLTIEDFNQRLEAGNCLLLFDGLDEAPDLTARKKISSFVDKVLKAHPQCRVVMTGRPAALVAPVMPAGFSLVEIAPLDDAAIDTFLDHWSAALYPLAMEKSRLHRRTLGEALQSRPEIQRMARNPVMLTALAVVHWNEASLPEQRAELYESVITWLVRSREQRPGRLSADRCRTLLKKLALAMFTHPSGRQRLVGLRWAAEQLAPEFIPKGGLAAQDDAYALEQAEYFLRDEIVDSGIIVERDHQRPRLEFWHLSFQEYLAACEIAGLLEKDQAKVLFADIERIYTAEWREVMLLLGGVFYKQGEDKINHLIDEIIARGPQQTTNENLPFLAGKVGLLGGIVRDLASFHFTPANSNYPEIVRSVNGIFNKDTYRNIPVQVRVEAADALGQVGDPRFKDNPMIAIPWGGFWMGAQKEDKNRPNFDPDANPLSKYGIEESPVHQVELSPFSISTYPITVGQYRRFIEDGGYEDKRYWEAEGFGQFKAPDKWEDQQQYPSRPVVRVNWYEAAAYARWAGGRLPTEAEWERVARGPGLEYRKYPWGNEEPTEETANFIKSNIGHITPVGIFPEDCSQEGVIDMAGNVGEWCSDRFSEKYYQKCADQGVVTDPPGSAEGNARVVRGGACDLDPGYLRCANRHYGSDPVGRDYNLGFRMVRGAQS